MYFSLGVFKKRFSRSDLRNYSLAVFRYTPDLFYKRPRITESDFDLDIVDIAYSTARTLCTYHLTSKELYFDIVASMLSHLNFVDTSHSNLLLSASRYNRLRDFSKNSRIGEMAQGINTFFVAKRLEFPFIIDFNLAKEKTAHILNIQTKSKMPDFVVMHRGLEKIGLYESKGTMTGTVTGKNGFLCDAMEQIDAVECPCFDYALPVCTKFESNNDDSSLQISGNTKSSINYALIEYDCSDERDLLKLTQLHYASWFYLVGDFERVSTILENGQIATLEGDENYELDNETDKQNPIYWVKRNFFDLSLSLDFDISLFIGMNSNSTENIFKIGIYKYIIDNLSANKKTVFELPDGTINGLRKYPDGTLLYIPIAL